MELGVVTLVTVPGRTSDRESSVTLLNKAGPTKPVFHVKIQSHYDQYGGGMAWQGRGHASLATPLGASKQNYVKSATLRMDIKIPVL